MRDSLQGSSIARTGAATSDKQRYARETFQIRLKVNGRRRSPCCALPHLSCSLPGRAESAACTLCSITRCAQCVCMFKLYHTWLVWAPGGLICAHGTTYMPCQCSKEELNSKVAAFVSEKLRVRSTSLEYALFFSFQAGACAVHNIAVKGAAFASVQCIAWMDGGMS